MDAYIIALRLVHIVAGAFWVGAAVVFFLFLEPAAAALGGPGQSFMRHLNAERRLPVVIAIASALNIVAGVLLYARVSAGFKQAWITSGPGIGITVGAVSAITSWLIGFLVSRPTIDRMSALAVASPAEAAPQMAMLTRRLRTAGGFGLGLLIVAVSAMSIARYL
jgi:uncharacterized membrane protein